MEKPSPMLQPPIVTLRALKAQRALGSMTYVGKPSTHGLIETHLKTYFEESPPVLLSAERLPSRAQPDELCACLENILVELECDEQHAAADEIDGASSSTRHPMRGAPLSMKFWPSIPENDDDVTFRFDPNAISNDSKPFGEGMMVKSIDGRDFTDFDYGIHLLRSASIQPPEDLSDFYMTVTSGVAPGSTSSADGYLCYAMDDCHLRRIPPGVRMCVVVQDPDAGSPGPDHRTGNVPQVTALSHP